MLDKEAWKAISEFYAKPKTADWRFPNSTASANVIAGSHWIPDNHPLYDGKDRPFVNFVGIDKVGAFSCLDSFSS